MLSMIERDRRIVLVSPASSAAFEIGDRMGGIDAEGTGDIEEFGHVEAPFATLEFRHKGLRPAKLLRQRNLRQSRLAARFHEDLAELRVFPAEGRPRHRCSVQSYYRISQNGLQCR